jgi:hypothetical protein
MWICRLLFSVILTAPTNKSPLQHSSNYYWSISVPASILVNNPPQMTSTLTRILGGTAFRWEAEKADKFNKWWETTEWAIKLDKNLSQETRSNSINLPRWDSKLRTASHWVHFRQGAKLYNEEPFLFYWSCNTTLKHPNTFNMGTTHIRSHILSEKYLSASGCQK